MELRRDLSREEMLALVRRIMRAEGTAEQADADVELFIANCKHRTGSDLIFWPSGFPHDPSKPEPMAEEIVEKAMSGIG
jgi:hypothetical protein